MLTIVSAARVCPPRRPAWWAYRCRALARRATFDLGPLTRQLRTELYELPYEAIDFAACRRRLAAADVFTPPPRLLRLGSAIFVQYERHPIGVLREAAVRRCLSRLRAEWAASAGQGVSPVSALLACLAEASVGAPRETVISALARLDAWQWDDQAHGLRIAGARSASWDTAFTMRALSCAPGTPQVLAALGRGYQWLAGAQATEELPLRLRRGRDRVLGGWSFSDGTHRWPVSDCTAEALSAVLIAHRRTDLLAYLGAPVPDQRLYEAVEFILSRQNPDAPSGASGSCSLCSQTAADGHTRRPAACSSGPPSWITAGTRTSSRPGPSRSHPVIPTGHSHASEVLCRQRGYAAGRVP